MKKISKMNLGLAGFVQSTISSKTSLLLICRNFHDKDICSIRENAVNNLLPRVTVFYPNFDKLT